MLMKTMRTMRLMRRRMRSDLMRRRVATVMGEWVAESTEWSDGDWCDDAGVEFRTET